MSILRWYIHLTREFFYFAPRALRRLLFPLRDRNPGMVKTNYDNRYQNDLDSFRKEKPSFENYLFGGSHTPEWVLVDGKVVFGPYAETYKSFLPQLEKFLAPYLVQSGATIVEFGCGNGRNLLYLKSRYPQIHFVGVELSPVGVELAREASAVYNLDVKFLQADLTVPVDFGLHAAMCYSCFSLEQMPRKIMGAVANMLRMTDGKIILFEPVPELYPWNLRGITSRCKAIMIDHVRNVTQTLKSNGFTIEYAKRLGMGDPLTEACVVIAHKSKEI